METLSNQRIAEILQQYSVAVDAKSSLVDGIQLYISLLLQWNRSISLTTVTDPEEIVRFHFGESFFAAFTISIGSGRLADVGSGAGFPGLPLKMLVPEIELTLIESNAKKAAFLEELRRRLMLDRVSIFRGRMEEFRGGRDSGPLDTFDFISARAFGQFDELLAWARTHLASSGKIVLWLGEDDCGAMSERKDWIWGKPTRMPGTQRRFILSGSPGT
ncbi:MAG TPA: 16S rRNA (guanine(527)-N(7))-methyltransferase RsmG [Candidatus Acidoferrales bacterium]|jgi:16S rRNA (guanine527-N7)-methyltransferase|nr:16S rRNA (guanine(527)-N(7))-methyltransferase RsmG [Candidatus Acidoferrales bacterium]